MRILHVDGARGWRGGQNQVLLTARGMATLGHDVRLVCQRNGVLAERARESGLTVTSTSFHGELSPAAVFSIVRGLRETRADIVQAHDPHALAATAVAARLYGHRRVIATRRVDFHLRSAFSRLKYRSSARVIAVSRAIAEVLKRDGLPEARLRIVYEGVPDRSVAHVRRGAVAELGVADDAMVVGNVAALTDHKDHATLLEAAALVLKRIPNAHFVILGDGECRGRLERRIGELGIEGRFILAGFRTDVDRFWPDFSVFCLSSHMEGLGTSVLDAMAFGLPIVATEAGGIPEAVESKVNGHLVPVRRPDLLAEALIDLLEHPQRRETFGRASRQRYESSFSDIRMVNETLRIYREIM